MNGPGGQDLQDLQIAVVLLNWHDETRTIEAARRVDRFGATGVKIVIDNESSNASEASLREQLAPGWVILVSPVNLGYGAAHNLAFSYLAGSSASGVLLLNTDALIEQRDFDLMVAALTCTSGAGVVAPVVYEHGGRRDRVQSAGASLRAWRGNVHQYREVRPGARVDYLTFACVLLRMRAIREVGGFDERFFMYWEDVDLCLRIREAGYSLELVADAGAVHELSASGGRAGSLLDTYGTWSALCFARKRGGVWPVSVRLRILVSAAVQSLRGNRGRARAGLRGLRIAATGARPGWEIVRALAAEARG